LCVSKVPKDDRNFISMAGKESKARMSDVDRRQST
jgi:hypothetical protein